MFGWLVNGREYLEHQLSVMKINNTDENQASESLIKIPPLAIVGARGSPNTNNDCTSQCSRCMIMLRLLVSLGILPKDMEVLNTLYAALETKRTLMYRSPAFHLLLEILHNLEPNRLVIFTIESILRIAETPELVSKHLLIMIKVHPNIKLLTVADFALCPVEKAILNAWYSDQYSSITVDLGCNRGAGFIGSDEEATLLRLIHTKADEIAARWDELDSDKPPLQIKAGIECGKKSHPRGKTVGAAVRRVVEKVQNAITSDDLPLNQQPNVDIDAITNKAITKYINPRTDVEKNKKVVIITRRTKSTAGCAVDKELFDDFESEATKTKFGIPVEQVAHCIAAGWTFKYKDEDGNTHTLIDDETELIVIFADDTDRKELYTELVETTMAHISDGDVLAVIAPTTIRVTAIRELFKPVQLTCDQTNTMLIMAEESSNELMKSVENEYQRQNRLAIRRVTLKTKEKNMREALPIVARLLSKFASEYISSRRLKSSRYLFRSALEHVLENDLGRSWWKSFKRLTTWEERFNQLVQYKEKFGDCNVPQTHPKLGPWINNQRQAKKGAYGRKISPEQINQLDSIGFKWELRKASKKEMYRNM